MAFLQIVTYRELKSVLNMMFSLVGGMGVLSKKKLKVDTENIK